MKGSRRDQKRNSDLKRKQSAVVSQNVKFVELNSDPVQKKLSQRYLKRISLQQRRKTKGYQDQLKKARKNWGKRGKNKRKVAATPRWKVLRQFSRPINQKVKHTLSLSQTGT